MEEKNNTCRRCGDVIIPTLERHPKTDKFVTFVLKPMFVAGLYSINQVSMYLQRRTGKPMDYHSQVIQEALEFSFKDNRNGGGDIVHEYWKWLVGSLLRFCNLDSAYQKMLQQFMRKYIEICIRDGYNLPENYKTKK